MAAQKFLITSLGLWWKLELNVIKVNFLLNDLSLFRAIRSRPVLTVIDCDQTGSHFVDAIDTINEIDLSSPDGSLQSHRAGGGGERPLT